MAVETNLKERKVDQISERLDKLKRRRIEIKPEPVKSKTQLPPPKMKMPDLGFLHFFGERALVCLYNTYYCYIE